MNKQKGFTIIELIVVVAIIAVLATIVTTSIIGYINKGKDAAIKANLNSLLTKGTQYFDSNGGYTSFCTSVNGGANIKTAIEASNLGGTFMCNCDTPGCMPGATKWCACSTLKAVSGNTFCTDYKGYKKETGTACATRCPVGGVCSD